MKYSDGKIMQQDRKLADNLHYSMSIKPNMNKPETCIFLKVLSAVWHTVNDVHTFSSDSASTLNIDFKT